MIVSRNEISRLVFSPKTHVVILVLEIAVVAASVWINAVFGSVYLSLALLGIAMLRPTIAQIQCRRLEFMQIFIGLNDPEPLLQQFEQRMWRWRTNFRLGSPSTWMATYEAGEWTLPALRELPHPFVVGIADVVANYAMNTIFLCLVVGNVLRFQSFMLPTNIWMIVAAVTLAALVIRTLVTRRFNSLARAETERVDREIELGRQAQAREANQAIAIDVR